MFTPFFPVSITANNGYFFSGVQGSFTYGQQFVSLVTFNKKKVKFKKKNKLRGNSKRIKWLFFKAANIPSDPLNINFY